nr:hypothetical protein [Micromonospora sp. DSM 115978]
MADDGYQVQAYALDGLAGSIRERADDLRRIGTELAAKPVEQSAFGRIPSVSAELSQSYRDTLTAGVEGIREYAELTDVIADAITAVRQSCVAADENIFDRYRSLDPNARF